MRGAVLVDGRGLVSGAVLVSGGLVSGRVLANRGPCERGLGERRSW